jgi:hypothetical protein
MTQQQNKMKEGLVDNYDNKTNLEKKNWSRRECEDSWGFQVEKINNLAKYVTKRKGPQHNLLLTQPNSWCRVSHSFGIK